MFLNSIKISDVKLELGQLIKSFRKRDKVSQQQLSEALDVSRVTVQNLESGKNFTIDTLLKVLQHFDALESFNKQVVEKKEENENMQSLY